MIVALRPYGNEIILMIKGSAIVAIVTVFDLMGETRRAYSRTFDFQTYIWAAVFYLVIVETLRNIWEKTRTAAHPPPQAVAPPIAACRARAFV
jgi:polar amino acid transport system permease protein